MRKRSLAMLLLGTASLSSVPASGRSGTSSASTRWLHGPAPDLLFGCGGLYLLIFVALALSGPAAMTWLPEGLLPLLAIFVLAPHYGATLVRVYEQRESRRRYAFFAVGITALLVFGFSISLYHYALGSFLVTIYIDWNSWHYAGQNYGLAIMFLKRRGVLVTPMTKRLFYASFVLSSFLAIVAMNGVGPEALYGPSLPRDGAKSIGMAYRFMPLGISDPIQGILMIAGLAAYGACVLTSLVLLMRRGTLADIAPALALVFTQSLWFVVPVAARYWDLFGGFLPLSGRDSRYTFMWIAFGHGIQYLWVTSYYAKKAGSYPGTRRYLLRCLFAGSMIWNLPGLVVVSLAIGSVAYTEGVALLLAAVVNLHHFVLDGAIWKLRDDGIGRVLLRALSQPRAGVASDERARWGLRAGLAVLGCLSLGLSLTDMWEREFGFRRAGKSGDVERMEQAALRLDWIGRGDASQRRRLALLARSRGDDDKALSELERSLAISNHPKAHFEKGHILADRGDWRGAALSYEAAYAIDDYPLKLIHKLANASLGIGRPARAQEVLIEGLRHHPRHPVLVKQLREANRQLSAAAAD